MDKNIKPDMANMDEQSLDAREEKLLKRRERRSRQNE